MSVGLVVPALRDDPMPERAPRLSLVQAQAAVAARAHSTSPPSWLRSGGLDMGGAMRSRSPQPVARVPGVPARPPSSSPVYSSRGLPASVHQQHPAAVRSATPAHPLGTASTRRSASLTQPVPAPSRGSTEGNPSLPSSTLLDAAQLSDLLQSSSAGPTAAQKALLGQPSPSAPPPYRAAHAAAASQGQAVHRSVSPSPPAGHSPRATARSASERSFARHSYPLASSPQQQQKDLMALHQQIQRQKQKLSPRASFASPARALSSSDLSELLGGRVGRKKRVSWSNEQVDVKYFIAEGA